MFWRTAVFHTLRNAPWIVAAHAGIGTDALTPATAGIFQHAGIIKSLCRGIKVVILPHAAKLTMTAAGGLASIDIYASIVVAAGDAEYFLLQFAILMPAFNQLDAL